MATLEMRESSKWWYGRWQVGGKRVFTNLRVPIEGKRPTSPGNEGDRRFRISREKAQAKLEELVSDSQTNKQAEALAQVVYKARTGHSLPSLKLDELVGEWADLPRRRQDLGAGYLAICRSHLERFVAHVKQHHPEVEAVSDVTHAMAETFMAGENARGISGRTYNGVLSLLKSTFKRLRRRAGLVDNPFEDIVSMEQNTVHRIPFTPEELKEILDAVENDDFCRPLIVTGICTAMRRGDVCQLRWRDVDMKRGFITVETSKTGVKVSIPMFELLRNELEKLPRTSEYCFPEQAEIYGAGPDKITKRLRRVFTAAGFGDDADDDADDDKGRGAKASSQPAEAPTGAEMTTQGRQRIKSCAQSAAVKAKMLQVFDLYMAGKSTAEIAAQMAISKGSVSLHFKRIEESTGFPVVRCRRPKRIGKARGAVHASRPGLKRVNQRGFHAFRSTWVTLALTAGVPMDLVRKVTGHTTADTVMTHYFQPGQEAFRKTLMAAMPTLLTGGEVALSPEERVKHVLDEMKTILDGMTAKTWKQCRDKLYALRA